MQIEQLQAEVGIWSERNFGKQPAYRRVLGVAEETGELCHAFLKMEQGIRGSEQEHLELAQDAIGDIIIYLCDLCAEMGWDLGEILSETWASVLQRDWVKNSKDGS